jgi:hypothetical protein
MNKVIWAPALCLALGAAGVVHAAPQVEADPNQNYVVTPETGPWMICAAYFTGPSAPDLARQLVLQIRSGHNKPAYVFDYAEEERKKQRELVEQHERNLPFAPPPDDGSDIVVPIPRRHTSVRVEEQCAVMIGGYADENAAHAALIEVKKWSPPSLKVRVRDGEEEFHWVCYDHGKEVMMNPFEKISMVVRNPAVPHDNTAVDPKKDPFLKTLNADEEYSMLRCPGTWTLAVKEYMGASMVQQQHAESSSFLKMIGLGGSRAGESLAVAANNAHVLADILKKRGGFEPYVLHTRTSSVVSVGAFDDPKDPAIAALAQKLADWQQEIASKAADQTKRDPLGLFATPVPIEVPHP